MDPGMQELSGKVAVAAGAPQGIGRAAAALPAGDGVQERRAGTGTGTGAALHCVTFTG